MERTLEIPFFKENKCTPPKKIERLDKPVKKAFWLEYEPETSSRGKTILAGVRLPV